MLLRCPDRNTPNVIPEADTHDRCVVCLGSHHDMDNCFSCLKFSDRGKKNRRQLYLVWRHLGGRRQDYPTPRTMERLKQKDPDVQRILGITYLRAPVRQPFQAEGRHGPTT